MIELKIDGEVYTEKEFQRDLKRYFDTLDKDWYPCGSYENCERCMFFKHSVCGKQCVRAVPINYSFNIIEKVYNWSKEHPIVTNRDKMIETFGGAYFNLIINYISDRSLEDYDNWLNEEYKGDQKNERKNTILL